MIVSEVMYDSVESLVDSSGHSNVGEGGWTWECIPDPCWEVEDDSRANRQMVNSSTDATSSLWGNHTKRVQAFTLRTAFHCISWAIPHHTNKNPKYV